jgi:acyl-CoA synthetase (AMP-forming)/AMP-acid ligase II
VTVTAFEIPAEAATVAQAFEAAAQRWPQLPFLQVLPETARIYGITAGALTYREAQQRVAALRAAYQRAGAGPGVRIGLLLGNRPDFLLHWFALNGLGASVVPISSDAQVAELEYLIAHSEIAAAIAPPSAHERLAQAAARAGCTVSLATPEAPPPALAPRRDRADGAQTLGGGAAECALLYTSGTTGHPKGCILPNRYFLKVGRWYADVGGMAQLRVARERMLTPLPLTHMNAMAYSTMAMVMTGGCLILLDRFHPDTWWQSVRDSAATVIHYLGVMPAMLMKAPPADDDRRHSVRFGFGAGVDRSLHAAFEQRFGFPLLEAWAMTETGAGAVIIANREPRNVGTNCFGREGAGVAARIVTERGTDADVDEPGELWVRSTASDPRDGFFAGYLKDEAATAEAWAGGWFHTGDIVKRGADGQLHFVDRRKNLIRRSGENIAAMEVESVLSRHPAVRAVAVAPTPDELRGEEVMALVVPQRPLVDGTDRVALAEELVALALRELAYYKAPGYIVFVDRLPLTSSNKIQRGEVKAWAAGLTASPDCVDTRRLKRRST